MRNIFVIILVLISIRVFAQEQLSAESQKFLNESLNEQKLDKKEYLNDFAKYNFSPLLMSNNDAIVGFIGDNYQKIDFRFISVIKNEEYPTKYFVYGKSKVKTNVCEFQGELEILNIRLFNEEQRKQMYNEAIEHGDSEAAARHDKPKGVVLAKYTYYEDATQKGSGVFLGIAKINFYLKDNQVYYDDLEKARKDNFSNNLCVGTWTSYKTGAEKKCNWGEYRIPCSGDLDIGAGEFSPNQKYLKNGWEDYSKGIKQESWL